MNGVTERVMIDNTHMVVLRGSGRTLEPAPEMAAFAERLGFLFVAHEIGGANRSARVERPFHFIENNFLAGRTFADWEDLNRQAREWCDRVNATYKKHIRAVPREPYAAERPLLKPLPVWLREVYRLHHRLVDVEGYVSLHTNRYSVPPAFIGRQVEVRETRDQIEIELDRRHIVRRRRIPTPDQVRVTLPEHRPPRGQGPYKRAPHPEETAILAAAPETAPYVENLKRHGRKVIALLLRRVTREYFRLEGNDD
ncbi:MAG: IS21 family transposase, partial [Bryobacterales bacterium]|nr:IS21 family transposase [Bryobacterales bacterium]